MNINWIIYNPDEIEVTIFDLEQYDISNVQGETNLRVIDGKFNSTVSGTYKIIIEEKFGQTYLAQFEVCEYTILWGRYPHDFNPAPIIASPFILIGILILLVGLIIGDSNNVKKSSK